MKLYLPRILDLCEQFPQKTLFVFQYENASPNLITGSNLVRKTKNLGSVLQQRIKSQEKVLLIFPQGLEYIYSLTACWYANVVAIPIPITDSLLKEQDIEKINLILKDSQATCIIADTCFKEFLRAHKSFDQISILYIDDIPEDESGNVEPRLQAPEELALLLYTSGSTSQPKGVMISHSNLMFQAGSTQWRIKTDSCIVSWMPQFHAFGLHFNILVPLLNGALSIILSPSSFIKNPEYWFKTIDHYQATHTAAPNFAFDYCCSSIENRSIEELSLSSLQAIVCAGEPIRKETYENFIVKFQEWGLKKNVFCPLYGLTELCPVTSQNLDEAMRFLSLDITSLAQRKVKYTKRKSKNKFVTSCGKIEEPTQIMIVNPETCAPCPPDELGEIWIKSPCKGMGYFNRKEETESIFSGILSNTNEDGFFRTGDLGFIENNHIYIVGREKEVIIIHGKNHYPVDIEWTIKESIPLLTLPVTVFSCEINDREKVVVVQEIDTSLSESDYNKITQKILSAVSEFHGIEIYTINLVSKGGIPKTGSGKIQRKACRNSYVNRELPILYQYRREISQLSSEVHESSLELSYREIREVLIKKVFLPILHIHPEEVLSFSELGLDSIQYMQISRKIEEIFKIQFTPAVLFKYQNCEDLAQYLSTQIVAPQFQTIVPTVQVKSQAKDLIISQDVGEKEIAIIGMSCNFPGGATNCNQLWENLATKKDCITPISQSRSQILVEYQNYYGELHDSFPQWGGFIADVDIFDASFFHISPREAESMDPQQRKLLELTWSVIEDSGYNPYKLAGKDIGVFVGVHNNDYAELVLRQPSLMENYGAYLDSGLHMSMIANRISRWFNFHGPSEVINTACSSSLVAVHHAVESIHRGESSLAIAGGINLILTSRVYRACHKAGMLSKDGHCKTFDQQADGFVRSEGYGAVLLKPLHQAIKDKDTSEPQSYEVICAFCEKLYSEEGMSTEY